MEDPHGNIGPVDVNMNGVIARSQALTVDALGKGFASQMSRQSILADKTAFEVDLEQAHAGRFLTTGTPNESTAKNGVLP